MFQILFFAALAFFVWRYLQREAEAERLRNEALEREEARERERLREQERLRQREAARLTDLLTRRPEILEAARFGHMHASQLRQVLDNAHLFAFSEAEVDFLRNQLDAALRMPNCPICQKLQLNCVCGREWIMKKHPSPRGMPVVATPRGPIAPRVTTPPRPATPPVSAVSTRPSPPTAPAVGISPTPRPKATARGRSDQEETPTDLSSFKPRLMALLRNGQLSKQDARGMLDNYDRYQLAADELESLRNYVLGTGNILSAQKFCGACLLLVSNCMCRN